MDTNLHDLTKDIFAWHDVKCHCATLKILPKNHETLRGDDQKTIDKLFFQTKAEAYLAVNAAWTPFHQANLISPIIFLVASMIVIDLL